MMTRTDTIRRRRVPVEERRDTLIRAALTVVAERGVVGATTRAIVAEAGMSVAGFRSTFATRDALFAELILRVLADEESAMEPVPPTGADLRDVVRWGLQLYFEHLRRDPLREKAMFELAHYAMRTPGMERLATAQYNRYRQLAAHELERAALLTDCVWRVPLDDAAAVLVGLTDGLTSTWLVDRDDARAALFMDVAAVSITALAVQP